MATLKQTQDWLISAILHPAAHQQEINDNVDSGKGRGGGLNAQQRRAIYGDAFYGRLHQVMQGEFPALRHAMEDDLFDHFVAHYLKAYTPISYTLNDLGGKFPKYLRETRPANEEELWPEFIIELAQLERTFQEVFHGEGFERSGDSHELLGETFEEIALEKHSVVHELSFPVHDYFLAFRRGDELDLLPEPKATRVVVYRRDYQVQMMVE
ncbi:DNA-binding domain-containing protein [Akkermansiaceae bacterium]|nr:DNA-binding domain-containing protein [Akkermansiaceae bacterium]